MSDNKTEHTRFSETDNHCGTAVYMTSGVHCCECWTRGERNAMAQRLITAAIDIFQTPTLKGTEVWKDAEQFISNCLADAKLP